MEDSQLTLWADAFYWSELLLTLSLMKSSIIWIILILTVLLPAREDQGSTPGNGRTAWFLCSINKKDIDSPATRSTPNNDHDTRVHIQETASPDHQAPVSVNIKDRTNNLDRVTVDCTTQYEFCWWQR